MPRRKPIIVIQGGQWGSEAKGAATAAIGRQRGASVYVRTGTVNAGHTVYYEGQPYKMQQLPVGWVDMDAKLVLGAGAFIHPEILEREIQMVSHWTGTDVRNRLFVDRNCGLHVPEHTLRSKDSGRHHKMGATGKGCSEAVIDKIRNRGQEYAQLYRDYPEKTELEVIDTSQFLNDMYDSGQQIVIEGTQGSHLDLHLGPYPYTTHKQTQAANWAAECGLGLGAEWEVVLVVRTYPIRVAGNSGPMPRETSWGTMADVMNSQMQGRGLDPIIHPNALLAWNEACLNVTARDWPQYEEYALAQWKLQYQIHLENGVANPAEQEFLSEMHQRAYSILLPHDQDELGKLFEFTTVTRKLRRVAKWDMTTVREAVQWNRPKYLVVTFLNYMLPHLWNRTQLEAEEIEEVAFQLGSLENELGVPVEYFNLGPQNEHFFNVPSQLHKVFKQPTIIK